MNYFEFFEIEESFIIDTAVLKRAYLQNSRKFHPDYFTLDEEDAQAEALRMSSLNNEAYNVLKDFDARVSYILTINEVLAEEGQNQVPNDFLMEMMEFNETLMELEMDLDIDQLKDTKSKVEEYSQELLDEIMPKMVRYTEATSDEKMKILEEAKDYFLKNKYLLRIREKLDTFAN